jgi:phosphate transport system protein
MGRVAMVLGNSARDVGLSLDIERAAQISADDEAMDELHRHFFTILIDEEWTHGVAAAVDITLLGRL